MADQTIPAIQNLRGNIGIGTASPSYKLEVDGGDFLVNTNNGGYVQVDDSDNSLKLSDNVKLKAGTGNDLSFYHNSTNNISFIENSHANGLRIKSDQLLIFAHNGSTLRADFGTAVKLLYNDAYKFETTAAGVAVTGRHNVSAAGADGINLSVDTTASSLSSRLMFSNSTTSQGFAIYNSGGEINFSTGAEIGNTSGSTKFKISTSAATSNVDLIMGGNHVQFADGGRLRLGDSNDIEMYHAGGHGFLVNGEGDFKIHQNVENGMIRFFNDDGTGSDITEYFRVDGSANQVIYSLPLTLINDKSLNLGTDNDLQLKHDGANSYINQTGTGNLHIRQTIADQDIFLSADNGSGTATTYIQLDGGNVRTKFAKPVLMQTGQQIYLHTTDTYISHDGTNHYLVNGTGDTTIQNNTADGDIKFKADSGNGSSQTEYFRLDGGGGYMLASKNILFGDDVHAQFGNVGDLVIKHVSDNSYIENTKGNLYISNTDDDTDIIFRNDNGSGGITEYFRLDGGGAPHPRTVFPDNSTLQFGGVGEGLQIFNDSADTYIQENTRHLYIKNNSANGQIYFQGDSGNGSSQTEYFRLDGNVGNITFTKELKLLDGVQIQFGYDVDMNIMHNGANGFITNAKGDLTIKSSEADKDIIFQADNGSGGGNVTTYFRCDGSYGGAGFPTTVFPNDASCRFGNSGELQIIRTSGHSYISNNASGNLYIRNASANEDIVFEADNGTGSGNVETYFYLDGSLSSGEPITVFPNDSHLRFGTNADFGIVHSTHSYLNNSTGDLYITQHANGKDIILRGDDGSGNVANYIELDGDGVQTIFHKQTRHNDGINAYFGDDNDMLVSHNGTIGTIQVGTGDLQLKAVGSASDLTFYAASTLLLSLDGGREVVHHHRGVEYNTVLVDDANHTVGTADHIILMHSLSAGRTVTINTSECNLGRVLIIKDRDGQTGMHNITIATQGSQTIDGAATKVINSGYGSVTLVCDGTNWSTI